MRTILLLLNTHYTDADRDLIQTIHQQHKIRGVVLFDRCIIYTNDLAVDQLPTAAKPAVRDAIFYAISLFNKTKELRVIILTDVAVDLISHTEHATIMNHICSKTLSGWKFDFIRGNLQDPAKQLISDAPYPQRTGSAPHKNHCQPIRRSKSSHCLGYSGITGPTLPLH